MIDEAVLLNARILILDDNEANVVLIERLLRHEGFRNTKALTDSRVVQAVLNTFQPDILLLDIQMPFLDGFGVMELLGPELENALFPILVLTADNNRETKRKALRAGAKDFLTKPIDAVETILRIRNLLTTRFLYQQVLQERQNLEGKVLERTRGLVKAQGEILDRLALAAEFRDDETGEHTKRVGRLAERLALAVGFTESEALILRKVAPLHDVGKIGIPDSILTKPGPLTYDERRIMETHVSIGAKILSGSQYKLMQVAEMVALYHHERWDGSGYPKGLRSHSIPMEARILSIVDVYDVLTNHRPYKEAWSQDAALQEIKRCQGTQFDPALVKIFVDLVYSDLASAGKQ